MFNLKFADAAVLVIYLIGTTVLGIWAGRRARGMAEYFMPRRFGKPLLLMYAFGTGTSSDSAVLVASATFRHGLSGIWYQWLWLLPTPFYWGVAALMRRFRAVTTADVLALRFDPSVAGLYAVVGVAGMAVKIGLLLKSAAVLLAASTGGRVGADAAILVTAALFVVYGAAGGLSAVIVADFVQGLLTLVFSFLLLPFLMTAVGGMAGVRRTIADPRMFSLVVPGKIGAFFIAMFSFQALAGLIAQPYLMGTCAAGRTEMDGRVGFMCGNFLKRICTAAWCLTALAAVAWYLQRGVDPAGVDPDHVYGQVAAALLPTAGPGLLGLFLAALLASVMDSCAAFMVSAAGLFTQNVYRPAVPGRTRSHYLLVARLTSAVTVAGGIVFAYRLPSITAGLDTWLEIAPQIGIAFWMGIFWRRMTAAAAWASTLAGSGTWLLTTRPWFVGAVGRLPFADALGLVWREAGRPAELYQPWEIVLYSAAAVAAGLIVSLLTRPAPPGRLDRFYELIRTPVAPGEPAPAEPCMLPAGVTAARRPMLLTAGGLGIPRPSLTSIFGFTAGWIAVAILVGGFAWLVGT